MTGKIFTRPGLRAFGVGLAMLITFLTAAESLPPVWDEGDSFARADSVLYWAKRVVPNQDGASVTPWSEKTLQKFFPNTVSREGHPAGYVIVIAAGKAFCDSVGLTKKTADKAADKTAGKRSDKAAKTEEGAKFGGIVSEKAAYRFGPILLWSVALAAAFYRLEKTFSLAAALFGAASILILPRVFVHSQIAFGDSILMSGWLLVWAFFDPALRKNRTALFWGFCLGLVMSAKFTGALAAIPFAIFAAGLLGKDSSAKRGGIRIFLIGFPTAVLTFYLLNPPIWHSPLSGIVTYIHLNTHRSSFNIAIRFLGEIYQLDRSLPWWNPLFWTAVTVPVGLLFSGVAVILFSLRSLLRRQASRGTETARSLKAANNGVPDAGAKNGPGAESFFDRRRAPLLLLILNWMTLIVVRMFPGLPVHDGVRLFIASFPFFGILAGIGLALLWEGRNVWFRLTAVLILTGSATSLAYYFPQGLSYYNLLIGGLPGAARAGMEAAYYWDGLDQDVVDFLAQNGRGTGKNDGQVRENRSPLLFSAASYQTLSRWRRWEEIAPEIETITRLAGKKDAGSVLTKTPFRFYLLQNRSGGLTPPDRWLLANRTPIWVKTAGRWNQSNAPSSGDSPEGVGAPAGWNPWDLSATPIVAVYAYSDFLTACRFSNKNRNSSH